MCSNWRPLALTFGSRRSKRSPKEDTYQQYAPKPDHNGEREMLPLMLAATPAPVNPPLVAQNLPEPDFFSNGQTQNRNRIMSRLVPVWSRLVPVWSQIRP